MVVDVNQESNSTPLHIISCTRLGIINRMIVDTMSKELARDYSITIHGSIVDVT